MSKGKMEKLHSRQEEKRKDYSLEGDQIRLKKSRLGLSSYSNSPIQKHESFPIMLLRLKGVAIDPCNPRTSAGSVKQSWSLILKARKILFLRNTEFPWVSSRPHFSFNKRNLHQFLRGTPTDTSDSASKKENEQSFTGLSSKQCSFASSVPCLLSRADSIESSNQPILRNPSLLAFDDSVSSSNSSRTEKPKRLNLQTCRRSIRLLNFIADQKQKYSREVTGKGRPNSCLCVSPGSPECIKCARKGSGWVLLS
ncbi:hypothetical protein HHK36_010793 [Tetracentron sinense]|uniref:Uncharacterized protein n=1 Tax=Tetracentron sinense TaxID=13715 RepID=A0A834ZB51_TETSI|nr:hypothetical protein HHK36_010793 [Tetracentron sinense]